MSEQTTDLAAWLDREEREAQREAEERYARWEAEDAQRALDAIDAQAAAERAEAATVAAQARKLVSAAEARARGAVVRSADAGLSAAERTAEEAAALAAARRADEWREIAKRAETRAVVVREPDVYGPTSRNSFFADVSAIMHPQARPDVRTAAQDRLEKYGTALARDNGKAGIRARAIWREATRKAADLESRSREEFRAMSTGGASGGALVVPVYVTEDYAAYRSASPTVWEQLTTTRPLPDYGMTVELPAFTGPADAGASSENSAPSEVDPTGAYRSVPIVMHSGVVTGSQQLADRAGPTGFDSVIYAQMREQLDADVDLAIVNAILTGASTVTRASGLAFGTFLADIGQAAAKLATSAGVRMAPSGVAAPATLAEYLLAQTTTSGDAWFKPSLGGTRNGGVTGQAVSGVPFLIDDTIPASGGDAQLILGNRAAAFTYAGEAMFDALPQGGLAGQLSVTFRLRQYVAPVVRYPAGYSVISGGAYPAAPTWA